MLLPPQDIRILLYGSIQISLTQLAKRVVTAPDFNW
jgi:hypothetical protein